MRSVTGRIATLCGGAAMALALAAPHVTRSETTAGDRVDARVTSADDLSLFVREYGAGETPILVLTGGPGYSGDYLAEVARRLGEQHRVLLPDQRGTGRSVINPWDVSLLTIEACVADVEALRVHSEAEQIVVVGHSWGGILALAYAAAHGAHVRALVLIGSGGTTSSWNARYSRNVLARLTPDDVAAVLKAQRLMVEDPEAATVAMIRATAPAMMMDRELALRLADQYSGPATLTPAVTIAMQGWLMQYDLGDGLSSLDAPVLVVSGKHDPVGVETAEEIAATFPNGELHVIADAAHEPYFEQPEAFHALVDPFLREHTTSEREEERK